MKFVDSAVESPIERQLKSALVLMDRRIEILEQQNRRLREQLELSARSHNQLVNTEARGAAEPAEAAENPPAENTWSVSIENDFVRLVGSVRGVHSDGWAEPKARIAFVSTRPLVEAKLEVWFRPVNAETFANLAFKVDHAGYTGRHASQLKVDGIGQLSVPLNVEPNAIFEINIECDHLCEVEAPDVRTLAYVLRGISFV